MFKDIYKAISNKEVRKRMLFTFLIFVVYRLGCVLTLPGINMSGFNIGADSVFAMMNLMGGGALSRFSIFALGISPYITASIIIQLLSMDVIPAFSEWRENGEKGKRQLEKATRYLAVLLVLLQGSAIIYGFDKQYGIMMRNDFFGYAYILAILLAGSMTIIWLGDQITLKGIGNGISMLIFAGIVSELPNTMLGAFASLGYGAEGTILASGVFKFALYALAYILLIFMVTLIETAERRIYVQSSQKGALTGSNMSFIAVKVNTAGVIPVIFAQAILTAPMTIAGFFSREAYEKLSSFLSLQSASGLILYALLAFFITFLYTGMILDPEDMSDNLKKNGTFIPTVRPGRDTTKCLRTIIMQTTLVGAIGLTILAVLPFILPMITGLSAASALGGTGLIVVVGVAIETIGAIEAKTIEEKYNTGWL